MIPDLGQIKALIVVFAMHGCGPCEEFLPRLAQKIDAAQKAGVPLHVWSPGEPIAPGEIPVLYYDAAAQSDELQDFADRLGITATPTTCLMTRGGTYKVEGSMAPDDIDRLLGAAQNANR